MSQRYIYIIKCLALILLFCNNIYAGEKKNFSYECESSISTNVALGKTATQSGTQNSGEASRAVDGNTNGNYWAGNSVTNTNWVNNAWWEVDLGEIYTVETINVWNRTDAMSNLLSNYHVFVSDVPFTSTDLGATLNQSGVNDYFQNTQAASPSTVTVNRTGRYIRIQLDGSGMLMVAEIEAMGTSGGGGCPAAGTACDDSDPNTTNDVEDGNCNCAGTPSSGGGSGCSTTTNLSLMKPTFGVGEHGTTSAEAVDGNTSGNFWVNPRVAFHSTYGDPWWEVDLGTIQNIELINIWNISSTGNLSNYSVFVSDSPFGSTNIPISTIRNMAGVTEYTFEGFSGSPSVYTVNRSGQYVRIQKDTDGGGFIAFAEVDVMGCASSNGGGQNQTITFNPISDKETTASPFNLNATASSGLPISYTVVSGPATVSGNIVTLTGVAGEVVIQADQAGDSNYNAAAPISQSFEVNEPSTGGCSSQENLSSMKPTFGVGEHGTTSAEAVDGNTSGNFWVNPRVAFHSTYGDPWWEVDLGTIQNIELINIWNISSTGNLSNYSVFVSDSPFGSTNIPTSTIRNMAGVTEYTFEGFSGSPSVYTINRSGQYVRIQKDTDGGGFIAFAEVEVMGCASSNGGGQNQTITFNSISDKETTAPPFNLNATASSGLPISYTVVSGSATVSGNTVTLTGVAGEVVIQADQLGDNNFNVASSVTQSFNVTTPSSGGGGCNGTLNLVEGKTANQSSFNSGYPLLAGNAIDGNGTTVSSTNWTGGDYRAWWQVDLGQEFSIETIKIWNGGNTSEEASHFKNYYVFFSNSLIPLEDSHPDDLINQGVEYLFFDQQASSSPSTIHPDINKTARYVRIQMKNPAFLRIAEVDVLGCEQSGGTPQIEQGIFADLKKKLDGNYILPINNKIYFTYLEDYAIVNGENDNVNYSILGYGNISYDTGMITNSYGVNWQSITLPSLSTGVYYTLKIDGINKDETYYVRFLYN